MLLYVYIYFFGIFFFVFHHKTCFYHFYFFFFFYKVSNFRNRILTSQEHELVVSNCHRNCMQINKIYLANGDSNGTSNYFSCGDKKIWLKVKNWKKKIQSSLYNVKTKYLLSIFQYCIYEHVIQMGNSQYY